MCSHVARNMPHERGCNFISRGDVMLVPSLGLYVCVYDSGYTRHIATVQ